MFKFQIDDFSGKYYVTPNFITQKYENFPNDLINHILLMLDFYLNTYTLF